jgi:hypothetical protein
MVGVRLRRTKGKGGPGRNPRDEALLRLAELRQKGAHRTGHPEDFYSGLTDVARTFAAQTDAGMGDEWTSSELVARIESRWGRESVGSLGGVVEVAERVKFGLVRPAPDLAESDWERTAAWVREVHPRSGDPPTRDSTPLGAHDR